MGRLNDILVGWRFTPKFFRIILIILLFWTAISIWLLTKKVDIDRSEYLEFEKQKVKLEVELKLQQERIKEQDSIVKVLYQKYKAIPFSKAETIINNKYEVKRTNVANLPIDSTVSNLAEWLK